jgi:hypothetical protein
MHVVLHAKNRPRSESPQSPPLALMILYIVLLVPGVFITLHALSAYPVLDGRVAMGVLLFGFLFPPVLLVISIVRNQPSADSLWLRWVFICASVALVLLGALLLVNGGLDRSAAREVRTTVLQKAAITGRRGAVQYHLSVVSWRPGISREDFNVAASLFNRAVVGKTVRVKLYGGYFGIPWYGSISPEGNEPNSNG